MQHYSQVVSTQPRPQHKRNVDLQEAPIASSQSRQQTTDLPNSSSVPPSGPIYQYPTCSSQISASFNTIPETTKLSISQHLQNLPDTYDELPCNQEQLKQTGPSQYAEQCLSPLQILPTAPQFTQSQGQFGILVRTAPFSHAANCSPTSTQAILCYKPHRQISCCLKASPTLCPAC